MPVKTFRSAHTFLKPEKKAGLRTLNKLSAQASQLERLEASIRAALPDFLAAECRGVALTGSAANCVLTVFISSSAWVTRARFHEQALRNALLHGHNLKPVRLHYQVLAASGPLNQRPRTEHRIPAASRALINATADDITDLALAAALKRLGRRGK